MGTTEDEMFGWHHPLNGHEFEQAPGVGDGQGSLQWVLQSMGSQRVGHDWVTELRLLRVPWAARRSKQSILKETSPEYSLGGLMLKLKLQYFVHLMLRTDSLEKTLMMEKIEGRRRRGQQRMRWLDGSPTQWTSIWVNSRSCWWTGRPGVLRFMGSQRVGHDWVTELNWTIWYD